MTFKFDPARLGVRLHDSMNLSGFAGKNGDVIVVVFDRKNFVAITLDGNGGPLEKGDVPGRIVQTDNHGEV